MPNRFTSLALVIKDGDSKLVTPANISAADQRDIDLFFGAESLRTATHILDMYEVELTLEDK